MSFCEAQTPQPQTDVRQTTEVGYRLLTETDETKENIVVSPIAIMQSLGLLAESSSGLTATMLAKYREGAISNSRAKELGSPLGYSAGALFKNASTAKGIEVVSTPEAGSALAAASIGIGDRITFVDEDAINDVAEFYSVASDANGTLRISGVKKDGSTFSNLKADLTKKRKFVPVSEKSIVILNAVVFRDGLRPTKKFLEAAEHFGSTELLRFGDLNDGKTKERVRKKTSDRLRLIDYKLATVPDFVISSQADFRLNWKKPFIDDGSTKEFTRADGTVQTTVFLRRRGLFKYCCDEDVEVFEIPFSDNGTRFRVWLPRVGVTTRRIASLLADASARLALIEQFENTVVELEMPKFSIASSFGPELLDHLGLRELRSPNANFSELSPEAALCEFRHSSEIDVNSTGVMARSKTVIVAAPRGSSYDSIHVVANRPFIFEIVEDDELPLFVGRLVDCGSGFQK